jgi:hypothetical protein
VLLAGGQNDFGAGSRSSRSDVDRDDGRIEDAELLLALDAWQDDEPMPGTEDVMLDDSAVGKLVRMWKKETEIGTQ